MKGLLGGQARDENELKLPAWQIQLVRVAAPVNAAAPSACRALLSLSSMLRQVVPQISTFQVVCVIT